MTKTRNATLVLAGDGLSAFGGWIDFLAILTLAAYQFHVSPYQMAIISALGLLPGIVLGPLIGRLCDRGNPKRLLLVSIVARVATTAAILFCGDYAAFAALVALRSVFTTVAPTAINVLAVGAVEPAGRPRFFAILNVLNNSAKVLAPMIGTVASSLTSEAVALVTSLVFSAAAFFVFAFVRTELTTQAPPGLTPGVEPVSAPTPAPGASLVPLLWVATTCAFFVFMVNNLVPLVLQQAGFDKALLGLLVSCSGAGNILSGLWLAKRTAPKALRGELAELLVPATFQAVGFGVMGLLIWARPGNPAAFLCALFFVIGTFSARYAIALSVHVAQHHAQSPGRVWGVLQSWQSAMILIAPMIGAAVLDRQGPAMLFALAAGSACLSFGLLLALRKFGAAWLRMPLRAAA